MDDTRSRVASRQRLPKFKPRLGPQARGRPFLPSRPWTASAGPWRQGSPKAFRRTRFMMPGSTGRRISSTRRGNSSAWDRGGEHRCALCPLCHAQPFRGRRISFEPQAGDRRFSDGLWKRLPYALWQQAFLAQEAWWRSATREVRGMTPKNAARISFITRQMLNVSSPSNLPWANPVVIDATMKQSGANLMRGAHNLQEDVSRALAMQPMPPADGLEVGKDLAITPGTVVFSNELMELSSTSLSLNA